MNTFRNTPFASIAAAAALSIGAIAFPAAASSSSASEEVKQQFRDLVQQRNRIARDLSKADSQAAEAIRQGREPVSMHARQQSLEGELDLVQLRLETMAVRHSLPLPEMPTPASVEETRRANAARANAAFDGGRDRARRVLERDAQRILASIDFAPFLASNAR
jgi:hypothetical protein